MERRRQRHNNASGIFALWQGWAVTIGSFMLLILGSLFIPKVWLPVVAFGLQVALFAATRQNRLGTSPSCYLLPFLASRVMFWSGIIMLIINLCYRYGLISYFSEPSYVNNDIPFITVLIVTPVATVVALWAMIRGKRITHCADCAMRHGTAAERGFLGVLFAQEGPYQVKSLLVFSAFLSIASWIYYIFFYINTDLNRPDHFFFVWLPLIYTLATYIFMAVRYAGVWSYYCHNVEFNCHNEFRATRLRFIIVCGDSMLLKEMDEADGHGIVHGKLDTPVSLYVHYQKSMSDYQARQYFEANSGLRDFDLRFMYSGETGNAETNFFHYIVTLNDPAAINGTRISGKWYSLSTVENLINNRRVASLLSSEVMRLWVVTMAWKTYDTYGRRLYKIKNYVPTFRLRDIGKWDVDFNDPRWIHIYYNNQDKPFWRLRRFWRRYVNGMSNDILHEDDPENTSQQ